MELKELIENTLRRKYLEEMMDRSEKEPTSLEGMEEVPIIGMQHSNIIKNPKVYYVTFSFNIILKI